MQLFKTPDELEIELGEQLRTERLRQNLTMHDIALRAGISEQTLRSLENGSGGRLNSFIRVMKALGKDEWLCTFPPAVRISPMDIVKRAGKQRLRATRSVIGQPGVRIKTWTGFMRLGQVCAGMPQDLNVPEIP